MGKLMADKLMAASAVDVRFGGLAPATLAVLIQFTALVVVLSSVAVIGLITPQYVSIFTLVLLQSFIATAFSVIAGMAKWWRWIHFIFPLALFGMLRWNIPSDIYLVGFFVSLSLFWTTFRSQVPFYPSRPIIWKKVSELIPQDKHVRMIDIGSGLGDMAMTMAKLRPDSRFEGIEIAPLPWLISLIRSIFSRSPARFKLGNYNQLNFSHYDVIFAYLSPAAMPALWEKASKEMRPQSLLISYEFEIPGVNPTLCIPSTKKSLMIYVWKI